jgi:hypothetical protein
MEEVIFPKAEVATLLKDIVRVRLHVDGKGPLLERCARNRALQLEHFGVPTLPLLAIVSPDAKDTLGTYSFTRDTNEFIAFIKESLPQKALPMLDIKDLSKK